MRPNFGLDTKLSRRWSLSANGSWSRGEAFHAYDNVSNRFLVSYEREMRATRRDGVESASVAYPFRLSFGLEQQTFYGFPGHTRTAVVPVISFTLF